MPIKKGAIYLKGIMQCKICLNRTKPFLNPILSAKKKKKREIEIAMEWRLVI